MQQIVIGAMAPNDAPQAATDMPAAQGAGPPDTVSAHTKLGNGHDTPDHYRPDSTAGRGTVGSR